MTDKQIDASLPERHEPKLGDKVVVGIDGKDVYTVVRVFERYGSKRARLFSEHQAITEWVSSLRVVELSAIHKLAIMTTELGETKIEFGHNEGWACEIGFGINLFRAERSTFDEAINACWAKWKGAQS